MTLSKVRPPLLDDLTWYRTPASVDALTTASTWLPSLWSAKTSSAPPAGTSLAADQLQPTSFDEMAPMGETA